LAGATARLALVAGALLLEAADVAGDDDLGLFDSLLVGTDICLIGCSTGLTGINICGVFASDNCCICFSTGRIGIETCLVGGSMPVACLAIDVEIVGACDRGAAAAAAFSSPTFLSMAMSIWGRNKPRPK